MSITLKGRLTCTAFSTGELQSGVLPRSVDAKIYCCIRVDFPMTAVERVKDIFGGKANGFLLGKFTALPAQSHGGLVKR